VITDHDIPAMVYALAGLEVDDRMSVAHGQVDVGRQLANTLGSTQRLKAVYDEDVTITDGNEDGQPDFSLSGAISFLKRVRYHYPQLDMARQLKTHPRVSERIIRIENVRAFSMGEPVCAPAPK